MTKQEKRPIYRGYASTISPKPSEPGCAPVCCGWGGLLTGLLRVFLSIGATCQALAAVPVPPAEKVLPESTLAMFTAPDFAKLNAAWKSSLPGRLLDDPAMKPFTDDLLARWNAQIVAPLERELGLSLAGWKGMCRGQVTLAVIAGNGPGQHDSSGIVLLADAADKGDELQKQLNSLRQKWRGSGRATSTEKLHDTEFTVISLNSSEAGGILGKLLPNTPEAQSVTVGKPLEIMIGQRGSLLVVGTVRNALERVLVRLSGGAQPTLAEVADFQTCRRSLSPESAGYGWLNAKLVLQALHSSQRAGGDDAENARPGIAPRKLLQTLGLSEVHSLAASFQSNPQGCLLQMFISMPETNRHGLMAVLGGEPRGTSIPAFVPADAVSFRQWRIDGQKAWAVLEKALNDLSPQFLNAVNFVVDSANLYANQKQPGFDVRKHLLGNIGNDFITCRRPINVGNEPQSNSPSLWLIGSPKPDELAASLGSMLIFLSRQASTPPHERDFLGCKMFSVPLGAPAASLGLWSSSEATPTLHYAASKGYVGLSTDAGTLEEFLRAGHSETNSLSGMPGLSAALRWVGGPSSSLLGYENESVRMRARFEALRNLPASSNSYPAPAAGLLPAAAGMLDSARSLKDRFDFSLLPPYDRVSRHFSFMVYGGGPSTDGLILRVFAPASPVWTK